MRKNYLTGGATGTIMEPSMEPFRVGEERDWDLRRLQDIRPSTERTVYGTIIDPLLSLVTSTYHSQCRHRLYSPSCSRHVPTHFALQVRPTADATSC